MGDSARISILLVSAFFICLKYFIIKKEWANYDNKNSHHSLWSQRVGFKYFISIDLGWEREKKAWLFGYQFHFIGSVDVKGTTIQLINNFLVCHGHKVLGWVLGMLTHSEKTSFWPNSGLWILTGKDVWMEISCSLHFFF